MPSNFHVRPYVASDEFGLVAVWRDAMWADPIDERTWRSRYLLDPNFDTNACLVAVDQKSGEIAGFVLGMSLVNVEPASIGKDAWVVGFGVAPLRRRQSIGRSLFKALESYWKTRGIARILIGPYVPSYVTPGVDESTCADAIAFLKDIGAETLNRPLSMKASLTNYRTADTATVHARRLETEGVIVREAEPADILPLLQFLDRHFPHWRPDATSVLQDVFGGDPRFVSMYVAVDNGVIVGYAQSRNERFGPFGVNEDYRGRGIGAVLLSRVLLSMREKGFHCAWFLWTSDRAAKLYRTHGFEEVRRFALMSKPIAH